jgi:hypothetical protein
LATPSKTPPIRLIGVIRIPAMASPFTNLLAPSIEPKKSASRSMSLRRCRATSDVIRSASIAICLPGMPSRANRAATFGHAAGAFGDHHEIDHHQGQEHDQADDDVAADHETPERFDDFAGGAVPGVAFEQDQPCRRDVQAQAEQRGHQDHRWKSAELERLLHEQTDQTPQR